MLREWVCRGILPVLLACFLQPVAWPEEAVPVAEDPALEVRVMRLAEELRCLVCQNQTIADSHAGLAIDLRNQIREQLQKGASDEEVRSYMVQRYGDFVLYRPPLKATTWLLWFGPLVLMLVGAVAFGLVLARRRGADGTETLAPEDARHATELLGDGDLR